MALLLVMIGMVVCTILTAGFLATQGTSIGIARNERDAAKSRALAQTGIDMCYWLIRNRADWREAMAPGKWLNGAAVGDGTVTVTVDKEYSTVRAPAAGTFSASAGGGAAAYVTEGSAVDTNTVVGKIGTAPVSAGVKGTVARVLVISGQSVDYNQPLFLVKTDATGNFADDPTQGVTLTSVGTFDNRAFTLLATVRPTGGGTVFKSGNFISGTIAVGNTDLISAATVDSYDSSVGPYSSLLPGTNASFVSNAAANNALTVYFPSAFRGSYTAGVGASLASAVNLVGAVMGGPTSVAAAVEPRTPGTVLPPNVAGLPYQGTMVRSPTQVGSNTFPGPGKYDNLSLTSTTVTIPSGGSGIYYITGNMNLGNGTAVLSVADGVSAVLFVNGTVNIQGRITLNGTARLAIYANGNVTINGGNVNVTGGVTNRLTLYGTSSCAQVQITNASTMYGSIYAPQAAVTMQANSPKLYGAVIANSLTLKNLAQLHFDEALRSLRISNVTGGSAAPGSADYTVTLTAGPGLGR
jgi:biotin carboxyl carrier protein